MSQLPRALQLLGSLQLSLASRSAILERIGRALFSSEPRPDDSIEPFVGGLSVQLKNTRLAQHPDYIELFREIPATQDVQHYAILRQEKRLCDWLIDTKFHERHRYLTSPSVYFGTLDMDQLNAMICPVPESDEYLVAINFHLWDAIDLVSDILVKSIRQDGHRLVFDAAAAQTLVDKYELILSRIVAHSPLPSSDMTARTAKYGWSWHSLRSTACRFVFAHEYAHFLHGHMQQQSRPVRISVGERACEGRATDWKNEYEADRTAMDLAVMLTQSISSSQGLRDTSTDGAQNFIKHTQLHQQGGTAALHGILLCLNVLCHLDQVMHNVYTVESSHPPSLLRLHHAWGVIGSQMPYGGAVIEQQLQPLSECFEFLADKCQSLQKGSGSGGHSECDFQGAVLSSLFSLRHDEVIGKLQLIDDELARSRVSTDSISAALTQQIPPKWLKCLGQPGARDSVPDERRALVQRTLAVVNCNAKILGFCKQQ